MIITKNYMFQIQAKKRRRSLNRKIYNIEFLNGMREGNSLHQGNPNMLCRKIKVVHHLNKLFLKQVRSKVLFTLKDFLPVKENLVRRLLKLPILCFLQIHQTLSSVRIQSSKQRKEQKRTYSTIDYMISNLERVTIEVYSRCNDYLSSS